MRWVLTVSRRENFCLSLMFSHHCLCQLACSFLLVCDGGRASHPQLRSLSGKSTVMLLFHVASCKANCNDTIAYDVPAELGTDRSHFSILYLHLVCHGRQELALLIWTVRKGVGSINQTISCSLAMCHDYITLAVFWVGMVLKVKLCPPIVPGLVKCDAFSPTVKKPYLMS